MIKIQINENIFLRQLEEADAKELFALVDNNRSHLQPWMLWLDNNKCIQDNLVFIHSTIEQFVENNGIHLAVFYKGKIAGLCGMTNYSEVNKKVEVGYWLGKEYQGLGLMAITLKEVLKYAFNTMKLNRVELKAATNNKRSRAVAEKIGFKHEGTLRKSDFVNGEFHDMEMYSMLIEEFK